MKINHSSFSNEWLWWISMFALLAALLVPAMSFAQSGESELPLNVNVPSVDTVQAQQVRRYTMGEFYQLTRDDKVVQALMVLQYTPAKQVATTVMDYNVHIVFKNLVELGKQFKQADAISWVLPNGERMIFIDEAHRYAPPQAVAAIIAHEVLHDDALNSVAEEITAWRQEMRTWQLMLKLYPNLATIPTGQYPLVDRLNALIKLDATQQLETTIANHKGYKGLPAHSPGF